MNIAIIIPVFNRKIKTLACLSNLYNIDTAGQSIQIIVVDDGSTDGTSDSINKEFPNVIVLKGNGDLWWSGAVSLGIEKALRDNYSHVLLLNDDISFENDFVYHIIKLSQEFPNALISSIKLSVTNHDKEVVLTGGFKETGLFREILDPNIGKDYTEINNSNYLECDALTGAALLIPTVIIETIGNFDISKFPHNWGDIEFTHRAKINNIVCLVATKSKIYTEPNLNYHRHYLLNSTKYNYVKNFFFYNKKFNYGFLALKNRAYMHRNKLKGTILFARYILSATEKLLLKLILPNALLHKYVKFRMG